MEFAGAIARLRAERLKWTIRARTLFHGPAFSIDAAPAKLCLAQRNEKLVHDFNTRAFEIRRLLLNPCNFAKEEMPAHGFRSAASSI